MKGAWRQGLTWIVILTCCRPIWAQTSSSGGSEEPPPTIELASSSLSARVVGPNPAYVGQMVQIELTLSRDDRAENKPAAFFPEVRVRDAIAILSLTAPPPETKTVDGIPFLLQKRLYLVFPQIQGTLTFPSVRVALPEGDAHRSVLESEPLELRVDVPTGVVDRLPLIARNVELERVIDGNIDELRVGDAFSVVLKLTAEGTDATVLPSLEPTKMEGLTAYSGKVTSSTSSERGDFRAEKSVQTTYVARSWGWYELPRRSVLWLDPETGTYSEAAVDALRFRARANASLGAGCVGGPRVVATMSALGASLLGLLLVSIQVGRRWARRRSERRNVIRSRDERNAFEALTRAADSGSDQATLTSLYRWLSVAFGRPVTLEEFRRRATHSEISRMTSELEARVAHRHTVGDARELVMELARYRTGFRPARANFGLQGLNEKPAVR